MFVLLFVDKIVRSGFWGCYNECLNCIRSYVGYLDVGGGLLCCLICFGWNLYCDSVLVIVLIISNCLDW